MEKRIKQLKNEAIDLLADKKETAGFLDSLENEVMILLNEEPLTEEQEKELKDIHYSLMQG